MPIKIPDNLPGRVTLAQENVPLILEDRALRQDIRPLQILILNLMPDKIGTETQLLRGLGATPLQIEVTFLHPATYTSRHTSQDHLTAFYKTYEDIADKRYDALIVTGAPVEHMEFEEVTYWKELARIFDWARTHVYGSFFICWGAQAALHHYNGVPKYPLERKHSGVFLHRVVRPFHSLLMGFDDFFPVPVSRHTEVRYADVNKHKDLEILIEADETGICLINDEKNRRVFVFNHLEYDAETLKNEYMRDTAAGKNPELPTHYFPSDDPEQEPRITWRAHRHLLFSNWINIIYQGTPYDLSELG